MPVIRANIASIMRGANPGVRVPRVSGAPGGIIRFGGFILGVGIPAIADIFLNPSTASAAEVIPGWRGLPRSDVRLGRVEITERIVIVDRPSAWNLNPNANGLWVRYSGIVNHWTDVGEMTAHEAHELEGLVESTDDPGLAPNNLPPPAFGWYREYEVHTIVRFNGRLE